MKAVKDTVFVVFHEPEYEGGGSYTGVRDIVRVFTKESEAKDYCSRYSAWYDYEEVELD